MNIPNTETAAAQDSAEIEWQAPIKEGADELNRRHAEMRSRCPVAHGVDGKTAGHVWTVFRRADIMAVARDPATYSNGQRVRLAARRVPLESDPPEHTELRRLLQTFFTPKQVQAFEPITSAIVDKVLAPFIAKGGGDFAVEVARKLPTQVLLARIGQPVADWSDVKDWSEDTLPREFKDADDERRFVAADERLWAYSRAVVEDRKAHPCDPSADIVSAMLQGVVGGQPIDESLVVGCVRLLLAAGHDSTTQALGICAHYLAQRPALQQQLRENPGLVKPAIEEMLRLESPVVAMPRIVARDTTLNGRVLRAGDKVMLNWSSANHDEDGFESVEEFRLDRGANAHLAFGFGIHTCLGAPLARQELRLVLETLLAATRSFSLEGPPELMNMTHYGFDRLPMRIESA